MTAKEKAKELVSVYFNIVFENPLEADCINLDTSKKSALICVDEILEFHDRIDVKYWKEVKQEINKL